MAFLSRDQILGCNELQTEEVNVPEWGGSVLVRAMTGLERDRFESSIMNTQGGKSPTLKYENIRAKLAQKTIVDPVDMRTPMFTEGDIDALGKLSAVALDRVFTAAQRLSGLTSEDVDEMAKN